MSRIHRTRPKHIIFAALCSSALWLGACSKDEAAPTEPVEAQSTKEDETIVEDSTPNEAPPPAEEPAPESQVANQEPPAPAPEPTPAPAPTEGVKPVVRYVSSKEAKIYAAPAEDKEPVGTLAKGERVMVFEEKGWGRINESMYVKLDQLSAKAVPRKKTPAVWSKPKKN